MRSAVAGLQPAIACAAAFFSTLNVQKWGADGSQLCHVTDHNVTTIV
jgi:hypothetical protein